MFSVGSPPPGSPLGLRDSVLARRSGGGDEAADGGFGGGAGGSHAPGGAGPGGALRSARNVLFTQDGTPQRMPPGAGSPGDGADAPAGPARREPFIIGVAGGTASGKTTVCDRIMQQLQEKRVVLIAQDSYYRGLTQHELANVKNYNFDHPDAIDVKTILDTLDLLKARKGVDVPVYDFVTHSRSAEVIKVNPADVVILEGILVLSIPEIRAKLNMKIFVDTDDDVRLARRIKRDTLDRGRSVDGVIEQYTKFVKPMFDAYVSPSKKYADVIIPWAGGENEVAIDLIVQHIRTKLGQDDLRRIYNNLKVLPPNFQVRCMHTLIRDRTAHMHDFVFYSDRLIRLVVEHGLGFLPFHEKQVETPTGALYNGVSFAKKLCGVSIIRSGEAMENALRACCKGIKLGKVLIHRKESDFGCNVVYHKLPHDIAERYALVLDPILATGNSARAAIQLLLDKGVREDHILFLTLIAAPAGIHMLCHNFPQITVVTSEIDDEVSEHGCVLPGIGEFGDRYYVGSDNKDGDSF